MVCAESEENFIMELYSAGQAAQDEIVKLQQHIEQVLQLNTPLKPNELISIDRLLIKIKDAEDEISEIKALIRLYDASSSTTNAVKNTEDVSEEQINKLLEEEAQLLKEQEKLLDEEKELQNKLLIVRPKKLKFIHLNPNLML